MKVSPLMFRFLQASVILVGLLVAGVIAYFILSSDIATESEDAKRKALITRVQSSAFAYYSRLQFYDGVCSDIGITEEMNCSTAEDQFAIEIPLTTGEYYCADSTGFREVTGWSKGDAVECPK